MEDKERVLDWLTELGELAKKQKELQNFYKKESDEEPFSSLLGVREDVHIMNAQAICELLGIEPNRKDWKTNEATATIVSFEMNGIMYFSLENFEVLEND